ncbi:MAG: EAL domain-containing protein [Deltaproteobacteria bacterium]|nr:EAL domain-containing protein [Deltaproteobacteria bacterium]
MSLRDEKPAAEPATATPARRPLTWTDPPGTCRDTGRHSTPMLVGTAVREIVDEIGLAEADVQKRAAFLDLGPRDAELLRRIRPRLTAEVIGEFAARLDRHLASFKETSGLLGSPGRRAKFGGVAERYLLKIAAGDWGAAYQQERIRLGVVHQHIGLEPRWYVGTYPRFLRVLFDAARAEFADDPASRADAIAACVKLAMLDVSLALEAYFHADHKALEHAARYDFVTGLPNRRYLAQKLDSLIARKAGYVDLFLVGINRFKTVNQTLGPEVGDRVLALAADRMRAIGDRADLVARVGSDVFAVVCADVCVPTAGGMTELILDGFERDFDLDGYSVSLGAAVGRASFAADASDRDTLIRRAEIALYEAKRLQTRVVPFHPEMERQSPEQLSILGELRLAIAAGQLELHFQPKVRVATGEPLGAEALLRWRHPKKGLMPPGLFIPFTEETDLIHPVSAWVVRDALRQLGEWNKAGIGGSVAINIAPRNLLDSGFPAEMAKAIADGGADPSRLMVEVTERGIMTDTRRAAESLQRIRDLGVRVSIDDFGTGNASLVYLKDLPTNELKVDLIFVRSMARSERDAAIVRSTILMAHSLGLSVTAEGVEDQESLDMLREYGCDAAQGYFIAKPLPAGEFARWWMERSGRG